MDDFNTMDEFNPQRPDDFLPNRNNRDRIRVNNALIQSVSGDRGTTFVTIAYVGFNNRNRNHVVTLIVNNDTRIRDESNRNIPARNLQPGMIIDATFSEAMTRSIPPQSQAFDIRVQSTPLPFDTTYGRIVDINARGQFIQTISNGNPASIIRFSISPQTRILNPFGRQISLSNLIPGLRVRVQHATFMTASIPPQTTAFEIQVMR